MKVKPTKIVPADLSKLLDKLKKNPDEVRGSYLLNGYRIQITKYNISNAERIKLFFQSRRNQGLCKRCGKKVTKTNPRTGKLYRLCEAHRKMELKNN